MISERERRYRRFQTVGRETVVRICNPAADADILEWLERAVSELYSVIVRDAEPSQYIGLTIASRCFKSGELWLSFRPVSEFEYEDLWKLIESAVQSNDGFVIDPCVKSRF